MGQDRMRLQKEKKKVFKMTEGPCDGCEKREKEERALT